MRLSWPEVLQSVIDQRLGDTVHTGLPGVIVAYDGKKKADVMPTIPRQYFDTETGGAQYLPMPIITNVPVAMPKGKNGGLTIPLAAGDAVFLSFAERAMDGWLNTGNPVNPVDNRQFDLSDAVAIPCIQTFNVESEALDECSISYKLGKVKVGADQKIAIGNNEAELLDIFDQTLDALITGVPAIATQLTDLKTLLAKIKGAL